ncbi:hypothetical protein OG607_32880 [Streptomyces sp. NBC_01537]|uniref:hypothetical protein n=1 Tax=Streptomyces sp. NBC_01537 TaxID=2903896 RepID=UPI00386B8F34
MTGDQTIDWAVKPEGKYVTRSPDERLHVDVRLYWHAGGVFQLAALTRAALKYAGQDIKVKCRALPRQDRITAYKSQYNHSFANLHEYDSGVSRIDQFLGFRRQSKQPKPGDLTFTPINDDDNASVIVIDDANLGFREDERHWGEVLQLARGDSCKWVVLKMSHDLKDGQDGTLWHKVRRLLESNERWLKEKLIVVTSVARMRDAEAEIGRGLSWDQSAQDVLYEVGNHEKLRTLRACPRLFVSFGPSGVMLIQHDEHLGEDAFNWQLVYNRELMEREWINSHNDGMMFGYGSALCAAVASELTQYGSNPDHGRAIKRGLVAMQKIYETGFNVPHPNEKSRHFSFFDTTFEKVEEHELHSQLCVTPPEQRNWPPRIKKEDYPPILSASDFDGHKVARKGKSGLPDYIPVGCFGKLVTVDHEEIESLHEIYNLIDTYCRNPRFDAKPLAIAVFGAPGAGKGYAIKQLAEPWMKGEDRENGLLTPLEFNLSQLNSASELIGALHQVRDIALDGQVPLVLWDEFDSPLRKQSLGWLRYFLAPIQDGKFQQEEQTHLIGPSIFVFAGGTSETFESFKKSAKETQGEGVKGNDFLSRLRGYVDIYGINASSGSRGGPQASVSLRRALILYSLFKKKGIAEDGAGFDVDPGVLQAFLTVPSYEHGVRSMDAIIEMSNLRSKEAYTRSSLPSREQLMLHVDGDKFLEIMRNHRHD